MSMTKEEIRDIFEATRDNNRRLRECPRHLFDTADRATAHQMGQRLTCKVCGGTMRLPDISKYIAGYEAAGRQADDILPGFRMSTESGRNP